MVSDELLAKVSDQFVTTRNFLGALSKFNSIIWRAAKFLVLNIAFCDKFVAKMWTV